ncbi:MAG: penicillin-binding protein 2 [Candidatus Zixiibacteriota bacterium]
MAVVSLVILVLVLGLFKLQLINHSELVEQSENNRIRVVPITPRRGAVYDREGRVIIDNRPSYTVSVVPTEEVKYKTLSNLAGVIGLDTLEIRKRVNKNMVSRYQPSPVKKDIPFEVVAILEEQNRDFPGVSYQMDRVRKYPRELGSETFTGYVGEVSEEQLEKKMIDYRLGSMIGKDGVEKYYDKLLRGKEGTAYIEVTASGQIIGPYEDREKVEAVSGADLTLAIDLDLQRCGAEAIDSFCCGAIVAMDPRSGEILAMVSYPTYDANIFSSVIPESTWLAISNDPDHPLLNRPLNGLYPPGSTTKLLTVGAGLEEGLINENTTFKPCFGGMQFGNRYFRCWEPSGHGRLTAVHAIEQSCDVFMYQLGLKLGVDVLSHYFDLCGFGKPTGVDLPNEYAGLNPNSDYYDKRYGYKKWTPTLVLNNSIGQGEILVTPLQLVQFFCGLANNGTVYRPHLVKRISKVGGEQIPVLPVMSFQLPFSQKTISLLMESMRLVVEGEHGTARSLRNKKYSLGGKTGTAQNPHGENHSWFVGVAPMENPEIVVCAIVENAGHGSEVAAPVVGKVIRTYMEKKMERENLAGLTGGENR